MKDLVLIVDDDPVISKLLGIILSNQYEVINKLNGIEAFRWLEEGNFPAIVISDLMMPYLDGSNFVRNLKISGFYRDTPVVVLSGSEHLEDIIAKMPFKVDGYLAKPFNPTELSKIIENILSKQKDHATN
jgi:two-component system, chemotaxis family, chemotaxis protein CheY